MLVNRSAVIPAWNFHFLVFNSATHCSQSIALNSKFNNVFNCWLQIVKPNFETPSLSHFGRLHLLRRWSPPSASYVRSGWWTSCRHESSSAQPCMTTCSSTTFTSSSKHATCDWMASLSLLQVRTLTCCSLPANHKQGSFGGTVFKKLVIYQPGKVWKKVCFGLLVCKKNTFPDFIFWHAFS